MHALQKYRFCFIAGLFAAGGSFFGKLPSLLQGPEMPFLNSLGQTTYCAFILCQCLPISLMIVSNLLNWRYYLKALQMSEQTLTATVLTAASNYVLSFLLGTLVFNEPLTVLSIAGCTLITLGLWFLCSDSENNQRQLKNG